MKFVTRIRIVTRGRTAEERDVVIEANSGLEAMNIAADLHASEGIVSKHGATPLPPDDPRPALNQVAEVKRRPGRPPASGGLD